MIDEHSLAYIQKILDTKKMKWNGHTMLEYGNQHFDTNSPSTNYYGGEWNYGIKNGYSCKVAKYWSNIIGISHVCLDLGGDDGSLKFDISENLINRLGAFKNRFSIATNFGTIEHFPDQYWCWANLHNMVKKDAVVVHTLPMVGHWAGHSRCFWRYTEKFIDGLCDSVEGYELIEKHTHDASKNDRWKYSQIYATIIVRNEDSPFITADQFEDLLVDTACTYDEENVYGYRWMKKPLEKLIKRDATDATLQEITEGIELKQERYHRPIYGVDIDAVREEDKISVN